MFKLRSKNISGTLEHIFNTLSVSEIQIPQNLISWDIRRKKVGTPIFTYDNGHDRNTELSKLPFRVPLVFDFLYYSRQLCPLSSMIHTYIHEVGSYLDS